MVPLVKSVRTVSIRRPIGNASEVEADREIVTASLGGNSTSERPYEQKSAALPPSSDDAETTPAETPAARPDKGGRVSMEDIDEYLWEVYQRQPTKKDRGGDFTWKDPAAAKRMGKTLQSYVVIGMDTDFRELVYHAGKAMDAAGLEWTIVSGFRDDWRQSIATGVKARTGYSRHGGSRAVGGYGHGRAVDVGHVDRERNNEVWKWLDANGAKYGLHRPFRGFDPPHVEPRVNWRRIASKLRRERTGLAAVADTETDSKAETDAREPVKSVRPAKRKKARPAKARGRSARGRRHR